MQTPADDTDDDDPFGELAAQREAARAVAPSGRHSLADLARAGLTDAEIAAATGLPLATVQASPDVLVPLGPAHDARVARAVYQAAVGSERWEDKLDKFGDIVRVREQVLPDTRAASFYLENRQRGDWGGQVKEGVRVVVVRQLPKPIADAIADADAIDVSPGETVAANPRGLSGRPGYGNEDS